VVSRDARFLEYAYEQGAAIGGAIGAGGEALKLLLTEDLQAACMLMRYWRTQMLFSTGL
jgi:serine/threonine-protein kinase HipA